MRASGDPDRELAALAGRQYGVVAHRQLRALGLTNRQVGLRLERARLHRRHPEVYAVGHTALTREGRWMAAVLACGRRAALSHWDGAALWGLMPLRGRRIHVSTPSRSARDPDPTVIRLHRIGTLREDERGMTDAIPVTTVARTILDLAPHLTPRALEDMIAQADRLGVFDRTALVRTLGLHPRQPGRRRLVDLLGMVAERGAADLRSALEVRMMQLCDDHGLPTPVANVPLAGILVDFHWPGTRLVVETDGYAYHSGRAAFERDRERDQELALAGYTVVRFTYNQVTRTPETVAQRLRRLLA
jgi:hypothetical protein